MTEIAEPADDKTYYKTCVTRNEVHPRSMARVLVYSSLDSPGAVDVFFLLSWSLTTSTLVGHFSSLPEKGREDSKDSRPCPTVSQYQFGRPCDVRYTTPLPHPTTPMEAVESICEQRMINLRGCAD